MSQPKQGESITGTIRLRVRGEPVEMTLTIPAAPVPPKVMLPVLRQMTGAIVAAMVRQATEQGQTVSCQAGCGACCRQLVPVSELEAQHLAELVAAMPEPKRSGIERRFAEAAGRLEENGLLAPLRDPAQRTQSLRELGLAYFGLGIPCPFLEQECCSIHPERPLSCREYLVTSPAENCASPSAETIRQVPMPASVSNALIDLNRSPFVPLILALAWARQNPGEMPARPGPEILKQIVESLSGKKIGA